MKQDDFEAYAKDLLDKAYDVLVKKGRDYAHADDHFANFKMVAKEAEITPQQAWVSGAYKHYARIMEQVRTGKVNSESFSGSVVDFINYLVLLHGYYDDTVDLAPGRGVFDKFMVDSKIPSSYPTYYIPYKEDV